MSKEIYIAKRDFEFRNDHWLIKINKGDRLAWFSFAVMRWPALFERVTE